jgi:hypothetical protein
MDRQTFAQQAEAFVAELLREYYRVRAGLKEQLQVAPIYRRYGHLFHEATVRRRLETLDGKENRYLAAFAARTYLENAVKEISEAVTNAELAATVEWNGEQIPYQNVRTVLVHEPRWQRRHELARRQRAIMVRQNPQRARRLERLHALARQLGFENYIAMIETLEDLDLHALAAQLRRFLDETDALFAQVLDGYLAQLDMPRAEVETADIAYLFRAPQFDAMFPTPRMVETLRATLAGMGLDLEAQRNLELDLEPRPRKSPRAFCAAIRIPDEVKLVIKPIGGQDDYESLFHEAGHAEHFVWVRRDLPFAFRYLGDDAVSETYAFLFQHLLQDPLWLGGILGQDSPEYRRFALFGKLYLLRRYAAKLIYELEHLHAHGPGDETRQAYTRLLGEATKVRVPPERYLEDVDDGFYAAGYLRAWIFEMQLRDYLRRNFGAAWWTNREAGAFLRELWAIGVRDSVDELARRLGHAGLEIRFLVEEFRNMFEGPQKTLSTAIRKFVPDFAAIYLWGIRGSGGC